MLTYYYTVQFVPDLVADERINVAMIASGKRLAVRTLKDWQRVYMFASDTGATDLAAWKSVGDMRAFVTERMSDALNAHPERMGALNIPTLRFLIGMWPDQLVLSYPRESVHEAEELLTTLAPRMLREPRKKETTA